MSDAGDIRELLAGWPFDPENDARIVRGKDGREILQVRTPGFSNSMGGSQAICQPSPANNPAAGCSTSWSSV